MDPKELFKAAMQHSCDYNCHWELEKRQLTESIVPGQSAWHKDSFDEDSPRKKDSNVSVDDFIERPRADGRVEQREQDSVVNAIDAGEDKIFLH